MYHIVSIGAGTGQAAILQWLIHLPQTKITALVTTTDNGWSSAMIRDSLDIPSPGDVRNVINAINPNDDVLSKLLNYRFSEGELSGTHLGNLIVGALSRICWTYEEGIATLNKLLSLPASVLPISNHPAQICAELSDGCILKGERQIIKRPRQDLTIRRYFLDKPHPAVQEWVDALAEADMIIICPGVLWTGIISTLLFEGMQQAIQQSHARLVYIANVMTYPSQTDNLSLSNHITLLETYLWRSVQDIIVNNTPLPRHILVQYARTQSFPVEIDTENLSPYHLIQADVLIDYDQIGDITSLNRASTLSQHVGDHLIRHDGEKVRKIIEKMLYST